MPKEDHPAALSNNSPLAGKTALITGASRGIGRAIALRLAQLGARLQLVARDERALVAVQQQITDQGGMAETLPCDLTSAAEIANLASRLEAGGSDILVNAAGIGRIGPPLHETSAEDFDAVLATNLRAPFLLMRAIVPGMIARGAGHIVNISSLAGQGPLANGAAYAASKWALNGLTYSAAEELRSHNIRVSVVAPGSVNTDFGRGGKDRAKMLQAEDVANVVAMLVTQPPQSFISEVRMRPTQKP
ncbi:MAG TPA: SDR family oxidoreductase [Acidobacteriaceae bacterium]|jgi:NAD(P)-dependent dehydrogenase (short-subunit alcohol dehydrogenase family)